MCFENVEFDVYSIILDDRRVPIEEGKIAIECTEISSFIQEKILPRSFE